MASTIYLMFLFVVSIINKNAFVCLFLMHVFPSAFIGLIGVVKGGATSQTELKCQKH
jgi:hypothetical protein